MKEPKYDIALVVGRFQPYHNVHHKLMQYALTQGKKVIVALGSAKSAPDVKNPFTPEMREKMIRACFDEETNKRLVFHGVRDYPYNENVWISEIQNIVLNEQEDSLDLPEEDDVLHRRKLNEQKVCIVGHLKDASSYYLNLFPQWVFESYYDSSKEAVNINATDIRAMYLAYDGTTAMRMALGQSRNCSVLSIRQKTWENLVPEPVANFMVEFSETETYENLAKEYEYIQKYKEDSKFKGLPFAPTFITTDAVVTCKGHILVVKRGMNPGKGLLGLPGGFLAEGLTLKDNVVKELKEETRIHMPTALLKGLIKDSNVFDYPQRSQRGRTVTHAYHIDIDVKVEDGLPLVKGGDDAAKAFWLPIAALGENEDKFFEDHIHIIRYFLGVA
jgi:bifunctional NMN adenylyltransferase/nudix hydrolase